MAPSGDSLVGIAPSGCPLQGVLDRVHEAAGVEVFVIRALGFLREAGWVARESGMERDAEGGWREVETGW